MTVLKRLRGSREVRISVDLGDCESSIARFAPQNLLVRLKSRRRQINKQQTNTFVCVCPHNQYVCPHNSPIIPIIHIISIIPKRKNPELSSIFAGKTGVFVNESGGTRTLDPRIKSPLLYQLSYALSFLWVIRLVVISKTGTMANR